MLTLHKLTGAGNCFLLVDLLPSRRKTTARNRTIPKASRRTLARRLCDIHTGIGADGLLFLESSRIADMQWDFYNADGSAAEMCGNAARCVGAYLLTQHSKTSPTTILTRSGIVTVEPSGKKLRGKFETFCVTMPAIRDIELGREFDFVDSGVPHAVIRLEKRALFQDLESLDKIVEKTRKQSRFKKRGVNVTFYFITNKNSGRIESLTFERGVSGYTQACGTGAVAAATSFAARQARTHGSVSVQVPGGRLIVELGRSRPLLTGPAVYIAELQTELIR